MVVRNLAVEDMLGAVVNGVGEKWEPAFVIPVVPDLAGGLPLLYK